MPNLTRRQQRFVEEYLLDLNAKQAAIRAGYSPKTSEWIGPQLLQKSHVVKSVNEAMVARAQRTGVTQDRVLRELERIAFADPRSVMSWGPDGVRLRRSEDLSDAEAALVSEVSESVTEAGGSLKLKTNDKLKALELVGRHLGMFTDKLALSGTVGIARVQRTVVDPAK